jgi:hypothetical protein
MGLLIYNEEEGKFIKPPLKNGNWKVPILLDEMKFLAKKAFLVLIQQ